jgi:hypothetical protein
MGGNQVSALNLTLVNEGLLQSKEVIQWHSTTRDKRPFEGVDEIVFFSILRRARISPPDFWLFLWAALLLGIQLHHLNSNSTLHISIFVQFYEVFLRIEPHFDLFTYLFHLESQPNDKVPYEVPRQGMEKKNTSRTNFWVVYQGAERPRKDRGSLKITREWSKTLQGWKSDRRMAWYDKKK